MTNKVFLLRISEALLRPKGADQAGYSEWTMPHGFVVIASCETEARNLAAKSETPEGGPWWSKPEQSSCEEVSLDGPPRIVMADEPTG